MSLNHLRSHFTDQRQLRKAIDDGAFDAVRRREVLHCIRPRVEDPYGCLPHLTSKNAGIDLEKSFETPQPAGVCIPRIVRPTLNYKIFWKASRALRSLHRPYGFHLSYSE